MTLTFDTRQPCDLRGPATCQYLPFICETRPWHGFVSLHPSAQVIRLEQGLDPCYGKDVAKVTSKYLVTVPRRIADAYHIRPGDDIDWAPAGETIRVSPAGKAAAPPDLESRLRLFDQATERYRKRRPARAAGRSASRGWTREDLYGRGRSH